MSYLRKAVNFVLFLVCSISKVFCLDFSQNYFRKSEVTQPCSLQYELGKEIYRLFNLFMLYMKK